MFSMLAIAALSFGTFSLTSCGDDDDEKTTDYNLYQQWETTDVKTVVGSSMAVYFDKLVLDLTQPGTGYLYGRFGEDAPAPDEVIGKYYTIMESDYTVNATSKTTGEVTFNNKTQTYTLGKNTLTVSANTGDNVLTANYRLTSGVKSEGPLPF